MRRTQYLSPVDRPSQRFGAIHCQYLSAHGGVLVQKIVRKRNTEPEILIRHDEDLGFGASYRDSLLPTNRLIHPIADDVSPSFKIGNRAHVVEAEGLIDIHVVGSAELIGHGDRNGLVHVAGRLGNAVLSTEFIGHLNVSSSHGFSLPRLSQDRVSGVQYSAGLHPRCGAHQEAAGAPCVRVSCRLVVGRRTPGETGFCQIHLRARLPRQLSANDGVFFPVLVVALNNTMPDLAEADAALLRAFAWYLDDHEAIVEEGPSSQRHRRWEGLYAAGGIALHWGDVPGLMLLRIEGEPIKGAPQLPGMSGSAGQEELIDCYWKQQLICSHFRGGQIRVEVADAHGCALDERGVDAGDVGGNCQFLCITEIHTAAGAFGADALDGDIANYCTAFVVSQAVFARGLSPQYEF